MKPIPLKKNNYRPINTFQNLSGQHILVFVNKSDSALWNPLANIIGNNKENIYVPDQRIMLIFSIADPLMLLSLSITFGSKCHWIDEIIIVTAKLNIIWTKVLQENHLNWILSPWNETGMKQNLNKKEIYFAAKIFIVCPKMENGCS